MPNYRRNRVRGGTYFFTITLKDRKECLLVDHVDCLRQSFEYCRQTQPFTMNAWVILPDHIHCIWTLPTGDSDYPSRWRAIKTKFCILLAGSWNNTPTKVWQRGYWEHTIRSESDFKNHVDYVHINPVKHRLVNCVCDWPHSSFHHYVRRGVYRRDWGGDNLVLPTVKTGE